MTSDELRNFGCDCALGIYTLFEIQERFSAAADAIAALEKACRVADKSLCRATCPGPRDYSGMNNAINCIRNALKATQ